jgi:hypothetical protein
MAYAYGIDIVDVTDSLDNNVEKVAVESADCLLEHCNEVSLGAGNWPSDSLEYREGYPVRVRLYQ